MAYKDFTSQSIWQKAFRLLLDVYRLTGSYPKEEKYGMTSDMRRAANSILHNPAEGYGRFDPKDKSRFYKISRGSAYELISQAHASLALNYLSEFDQDSIINQAKEIIDENDRMIMSLESRLSNRKV